MKAIIFVASAVAALVGALFASQPEKSKGTVLLFLSTDCPVAAQYTPRINALVKDHPAFAFKAFFPNDLESRAGVDAYMKERDYAFPAELDLGAAQAKKLKVARVPTAVVLDGSGKRIYIGAIDNHKDSRLVKDSYLDEVLDSLAAGKPAKLSATEAFGCALMASAPVPPADKVNYAEHIAPLLNAHCIECHRPGEVAPFSLIGYEQAKKWAPMIASTTAAKKMPPWKAVLGYGEFLDENRLTETELATLKQWNASGAPRGNAKKEPKPPTFAGEWTLGKPNMTLSQSRPYKLDGEGSDDYRNFVLPLHNKETLWVTGMDVRPGNKKVVHHVIAFIDTKGQGAKMAERTTDGKEGYSSFGGVGFGPQGSLGGWAPGLRARHTPAGTAFEVPPNSSIIMQVHYHKNGKLEEDITRLGLYTTKETPEKSIRLAWIANPFFRLPPGAKAHPVKIEYKVSRDVTIHGAMPHMHLLGRTMKATVVYPDGSTKPLVYIDDWDFNWQMAYVLKQPMKLPFGSKIVVEGTYDNSDSNPNNPNNPPKTVTWGEETTDEMFLLVVPYTVDSESLRK